MLHQLDTIRAQVDRTHHGLGGLVAIAALSHKAHKTLLIVAPAGCGKSVTGLVMKANLPEVHLLDSVTRAGLQPLQAWLEGYGGLVIVDDLGKIDTNYSRISTLTTFCELVYSHFLEKHSIGTHVVVNDFRGSAIMNCQPSVLKRVIFAPEWEATIQDKTIRYYHLFRPLNPDSELPHIEIDWGIPIDRVAPPSLRNVAGEKLMQIGLVQWSRARAKEHVTDLLRAMAAMEGRDHVTPGDMKLLLRMLAPMTLEKAVITKSDFEEGRALNANLLCILVEFASYGTFGLADLARDYKVSEVTARGLMARERSWWVSQHNSEERFFPTEALAKMLRQLGARIPKGVDNGRSA